MGCGGEQAAWEELLGFDISKPLPMEAGGSEQAPGGLPGGMDEQIQALFNKQEYDAGDIEIDPVENLEADEELAGESSFLHRPGRVYNGICL